MNTNSNTYTVVYSIILVVIVAAVLAFAAKFLQPTQDENIKKDTIGQILTAATLTNVEDAAILDTYKQEIESAILVDIEGNKVGELDINSCEVYGNSELKKQIAELQKKPLAKSAHEEVTATVHMQKTGDKGLDKLASRFSKK